MTTLISRNVRPTARCRTAMFSIENGNSSQQHWPEAVNDRGPAASSPSVLEAFADGVASVCGADSDLARAAVRLSRHRTVENLDGFEKILWTLPENVVQAITSAMLEEFRRMDFEHLRRESTLREQAKINPRGYVVDFSRAERPKRANYLRETLNRFIVRTRGLSLRTAGM